jgi:hypothetical protein
MGMWATIIGERGVNYSEVQTRQQHTGDHHLSTENPSVKSKNIMKYKPPTDYGHSTVSGSEEEKSAGDELGEHCEWDSALKTLPLKKRGVQLLIH